MWPKPIQSLWISDLFRGTWDWSGWCGVNVGGLMLLYHFSTTREAGLKRSQRKEANRAKAPAAKWSQSPDITNDLISSTYCLIHLEPGFCHPWMKAYWPVHYLLFLTACRKDVHLTLPGFKDILYYYYCHYYHYYFQPWIKVPTHFVDHQLFSVNKAVRGATSFTHRAEPFLRAAVVPSTLALVPKHHC